MSLCLDFSDQDTSSLSDIFEGLDYAYRSAQIDGGCTTTELLELECSLAALELEMHFRSTGEWECDPITVDWLSAASADEDPTDYPDYDNVPF